MAGVNPTALASSTKAGVNPTAALNDRDDDDDDSSSDDDGGNVTLISVEGIAVPVPRKVVKASPISVAMGTRAEGYEIKRSAKVLQLVSQFAEYNEIMRMEIQICSMKLDLAVQHWYADFIGKLDNRTLADLFECARMLEYRELMKLCSLRLSISLCLGGESGVSGGGGGAGGASCAAQKRKRGRK